MKILRVIAERILMEQIMGLLALITLILLFIEVFVPLLGASRIVCAAIGWLIIAFFIAEYGTQLILARSKLWYIKDPWSILNLLIIVLPFVGLWLLSHFTYSPILRLLRIARPIAFSI